MEVKNTIVALVLLGMAVLVIGFFVMQKTKPMKIEDDNFKMIELTKDIIYNLSISDIIYTEISEPGAMGNAGGIMIYVIENQELICYETDWFDNKEMYLETGKLLLKHQNEYKNELLKIDETPDEYKLFFDYHYGGVGNHVFIKKNISLIQNDNFFIYKMDNENYQINCSRLGVFNSVVYSMKNKKKQ